MKRQYIKKEYAKFGISFFAFDRIVFPNITGPRVYQITLRFGKKVNV